MPIANLLTTTVKRCPMCHLANRSSAERCDCGYRFGENIDDLRNMLTYQLTRGWIAAIGGGLLMLGGIAGMVVLRGIFLFAIIFGGAVMARGIRVISRTRDSQRQVAEKTQLPPARLLK